MPLTRYKTEARFSEAVVVNGLIFTSGQVPVNASADAQAQTADVLAQIDMILHDLRSDKSKIIDATIFLANMDDYQAMNAAWDAWVAPKSSPARATVEAKLANPAWKVEIKIIAAQ